MKRRTAIRIIAAIMVLTISMPAYAYDGSIFEQCEPTELYEEEKVFDDAFSDIVDLAEDEQTSGIIDTALNEDLYNESNEGVNLDISSCKENFKIITDKIISSGTPYGSSQPNAMRLAGAVTAEDGKMYEIVLIYDTESGRLNMFVLEYASLTATKQDYQYIMIFNLKDYKFVSSSYRYWKDEFNFTDGYLEKDIASFTQNDHLSYVVDSNYSSLSNLQLMLLAQKAEPVWFAVMEKYLSDVFSMDLKSIGFAKYHPVYADSITLDKTNVSLVIDETIELKATLTPEDATDNITWSSSDQGVARVDDKGVVTAIKEGTAKITASAKNVSASCEVNVMKRTISLNKTSLMLEEGKKESLIATITPLKEGAVKWSSMNENIATVSENGEVTAIARGNTTIKVEFEDISATCEVTVYHVPVTHDATIVAGQSIDLKKVCFYEFDAYQISRFKASKKIVTISKKGMLKGSKKGTVVIKAQRKIDKKHYEDLWTCTIKVLSKPKLSFSKSKVYVGSSVNANDYFKNNDKSDYEVTYWESSNSSKVKIDPKTGAMNPISSGTVKITAYFGEKGQKGTYKVTAKLKVKK